jgi:hypothetical protein
MIFFFCNIHFFFKNLTLFFKSFVVLGGFQKMKGNVRLLYWKGNAVRQKPMIMLGNVELSQISATHMEVYCGTYDLPDEPQVLCQELFAQFNGEENPLSNPKSQEFIVANLLHTSMSVGDLVQIRRGGGADIETWVCASLGWRKL